MWGEEVNSAAKLGEDTAKSGEVLVTGARDSLGDSPVVRLEPIEQHFHGSKRNYRLIFDG